MALRVLLADESSTIKKVMHLALQDFGVEVKSVHVGIDVVAVAKQFKPDIVFADVLLQKRNGYEVCQDLKKEPQLKRVPVVLMWSSFMQFDAELASSCGAEDRLEKPFDVESLRQMIKRLVTSIQDQPIAGFLDFPESIAAPLRQEVQNQSESSHPRQPAPSKNWNMDSFEDINNYTNSLERSIPEPAEETFDLDAGGQNHTEDPPDRSTVQLNDQTASIEEDDFQPLQVTAKKQEDPASETATIPIASQLSRKSKPSSRPSQDEEADSWSMQGIESFKLNLSEEELASADPILPNNVDLNDSGILESMPEAEGPALELEPFDSEATGQTASLSARGLEDDVRKDLREIVERVVRELLPAIAERVVRQELEKILDEPSQSESEL